MTEPLTMWTVYDHPSDYPNGFIARRFEVGHGVVPTDSVLVAEDVETLRTIFTERLGLMRLERDKDDDPTIMEVWF